MTEPFLLLQLSDPHIGADWVDADPVATLRAAIAEAVALPERPGAVIVTGDLANSAADAEYASLSAALSRLRAPVHVLPGNHDDRAVMRRHFGLGDTPGADGDPIQYAVDLGPLRLLMLDTTRPGESGGALDAGRLAWLAAELVAAPDTPTLIAMHHPPFDSGLPAADRIGLPRADRRALRELIGAHPQVRGIVAGHVHRTIVAEFAGRPALAIPATYAQASLDFRSTELVLMPAAPGFAVHAVLDGALVSHVHTVRASGA